jgi:hypothetical protein
MYWSMEAGAFSQGMHVGEYRKEEETDKNEWQSLDFAKVEKE